MIEIDGTINVSARSLARTLGDYPEECAEVLKWLASLGDDVFREELSHHLQTVTSPA